MFTGSGIAAAVVGALLLLAGILGDFPELIVLGLTCAIALLVAALWMTRRPHVEARREIQPLRVAEGELARAVLTLTNLSAGRSPPILALEHVGNREVGVPLPSLAGKAATTAVYPLPTKRRGLYPVGPLTIGHSDPLRLLRTGKEYASQSVLRVHPRVDAVAALPTGLARDMEGPTSDTAPRGGIAFHSLREYDPGDDLRLIHWRASAKQGKLMVRHNVVPNEPRLLVVLDTDAASYPEGEETETFEHAVRAAASLCDAATRDGFPLEFRSTGGLSAVAERGADQARVLDVLAEVERSDDDPGLYGLLMRLPQQEGVTLGVVTGRPSTKQLGAIAAVRPRFQMVSVISFAEPGADGLNRPPDVGGALSVSAATSEEFVTSWNAMVLR